MELRLELGKRGVGRGISPEEVAFDQKMGRNMGCVAVVLGQGSAAAGRMLAGAFAVTQSRSSGCLFEQCAEKAPEVSLC